jgi:uncharacterized YkwD family protein
MKKITFVLLLVLVTLASNAPGVSAASSQPNTASVKSKTSNDVTITLTRINQDTFYYRDSSTGSAYNPASSSSTVKPTGNTNQTTGSSTPSTILKPTTPVNTPAPQPTGDLATFEQQVAELVNAERAKNGLKPLTVNPALTNIARLKSQDMITKNYFAHTSPTYGDLTAMLDRFGLSYRLAGENIAYGQADPASVMKSWLASSGHKANILRSGFTQIGIGAVKSPSGRIYWTQLFMTP